MDLQNVDTESKLPQELLDYIVDDLSDDRRTLITLLLVAHRFGERCRRWIYHTLHLTNDDDSCCHPHDRRVPLTAFYKHVMRYPSSGCPRIHSLIITLECPTNNRLSGRIKAVLFYAFNLQELSVHFAQYSAEWALDYPRLFRTLASPSVVTLELACFEDWRTLGDYSGEQVAQLLTQFPRLRCLKAGGTLRPISSPIAISLPNIETLRVSADCLWCLRTPPFSMRALRHLVIDYGELFTGYATGLRMAHKSFLSAIPESVQSLSIIVETSYLHGYTVDEVLLQTVMASCILRFPDFQMFRVPHLIIQIQGDMYPRSGKAPIVTEWFINTLHSALRADTVITIEKLTIMVDITHTTECDLAIWQELNIALSDPRVLHNLRRLKIVLRFVRAPLWDISSCGERFMWSAERVERCFSLARPTALTVETTFV